MRVLRNIYFIVLTIAFFSCDKAASDSAAASATGKGGSLAKFTIAGNYLYAVSMHYLYAVNITDPAHPVKINQNPFNYDMETIYTYRGHLYIGSKTGIYIYSIDTAWAPRLIGEAKHGRSCDPVVANDSVSYSTLKGSTYCGPATSGLYVYDVKNLNLPVLKKTIPIDEPIGLGMADSALYVCCAGEGMKVYSIKDAYNPDLKKTVTGYSYTDLIPYDDLLIAWVSDGIALYDISNRLQPVFVKYIAN